jgi:hypothetical protein
MFLAGVSHIYIRSKSLNGSEDHGKNRISRQKR